METETIKRIVSDEYIKKNKLDADSRVYLEPFMRKMFIGSPEYIEPLRLDFEDTIAYKKITAKKVQTRRITQEEYESLEKSQKKCMKKIKSPIWIFCLIFDVIVIIMCITSFDSMDKIAWIFIGSMLLLLNIAEFFVVISENNKLMDPDSQIAEGNVVLLDRVINDHVRNYVMVAFHDQEAYMQRVRCSFSDYDRMSVGSKVYVRVIGSSATLFRIK